MACVLFSFLRDPFTITDAKFANTWQKTVVSAFAQDGSKLAKMEADAFAAAVSDMTKKMNEDIAPKGGGKVGLSELSPWLADYEQSDQLGAHYIEMPGQYTGTCKPQPELHVRVSSFDPSLLVMGSLRKPKRLKIHGSDEREHPFLVKGGEDLRLDQRVQQLFAVMNEMFALDAACCQRKLRLRTYQVIPMTNKVGILQWMENTMPVKNLIEEQIAKNDGKKPSDPTANILHSKAAKEYSAFIDSFKTTSKRHIRHLSALTQSLSHSHVHLRVPI